MTFAPITSIAVETTKEDNEKLDYVIALTASLINKMHETSLYNAECQDYDDIYTLDFDELNRVKFVLDKLKDIQNIC